jgi:hypothetical protein
VAVGSWQVAVGGWRLAVCRWQLAGGCMRKLNHVLAALIKSKEAIYFRQWMQKMLNQKKEPFVLVNF